MFLNNKLSIKNSIHIVALGYGLLLLLLVLSSVFFFSLERHIKQTAEQLHITGQQQSNLGEMVRGARERSTLLLRMTSTNDIF